MKRASARELHPQTRRQISGVIQIALGVLLLLSLQGDAGVAGQRLNAAITALVGAWGVLLPIFLITSGVFQWFGDTKRLHLKRSIGLVLCFLSFLGIAHMGASFGEL